VFLLNGPKGTTNGTPGSRKIGHREVFRPVRNQRQTQSFRLKRIQRALTLCTWHIFTGWNGQLYSQKRTYWWLHNTLGSTIFWWKVNLPILRSHNHLYIYTQVFLASPGFYLGSHHVRIKVENAALVWFLSWPVSLIFQSLPHVKYNLSNGQCR
jgi:hypothetical protein